MALLGVVRDRGRVVAAVEAQRRERWGLGGGEVAAAAEVDEAVAARIAGQAAADEEAEVPRAAEAAHVVEGEEGGDAEVAEIEEGDVVAALRQVIDDVEDAEWAGDLLQLTALHRSVDDADLAARAGGA